MRPVIASLALLICTAFVAHLPAAEPSPLVTRLLERIPRTPEEVGEAHDKSEQGCVELAEGIPLAQQGFRERVIYDVRLPRAGKLISQSVPYDCGRWPIIDYGTGMTGADRKKLPFFTSGMILDVIDNTYVTIQARVHRASPGGEPYLHYVPMAGVGEYGKLDGMTEFSALQQLAVSNVRGLGLFLKPGQPRTPQALRTLVISIKGNRFVEPDDPNATKTAPTLELLFVRLRVDPVAAGDSLENAVRLYAFGTMDGLTKIVQFKPYATPAKAEDCTIRSMVCITEYSLAGQVPSGRAARQVRVNTEKEFSVATLDEFARRRGLTGGVFDNLTEILDAIIDGKLP